MKRHSTAIWNGTGKEGSGHLSTQSPVLQKVQYTWGSRYEQGVGTNPEELIAAAHAGCFTMKLSFVLNAAGFTADEIETKCVITLDPPVGITTSELYCKATVPGIDDKTFQECAEKAKNECPVSKALGAIDVKLEASLA